MAKKVQVILIDDIDGSEADESVDFAIDGVQYQIDLTQKNAQKLRAALEPYVNAGHRVAGTRKRTAKKASSSSTSGDAAAIRAWARDNGHEVPARGRIPAAVRDAYAAAH